MIQVIDAFTVHREERYPDRSDHLPEGLWVVLAPEQTTHITPPLAGQTTVITRPDGSVIERRTDGAEVRHSVLALHFRQARADEIPRLSTIDWR
jgi:hypothetical protein